MTLTETRELRALFERAHAAGYAAATAVVPEPLHVVERANPLDDRSPIVRRYAPVADGLCGFAWITIRPGTGKAARFAKAEWNGRKAYEGGIQIWVGAYNQSHTRKVAYATAFAETLRAAGITAWAGDRLD